MHGDHVDEDMPALNRTGFVDLYRFLRRRDEFERPMAPGVVAVSDTLVFEHDRPVAWYFTAADGTLKRKHGINIDPAQFVVQLRRRSRAARHDVLGLRVCTRTGAAETGEVEHLNEDGVGASPGSIVRPPRLLLLQGSRARRGRAARPLTRVRRAQTVSCTARRSRGACCRRLCSRAATTMVGAVWRAHAPFPSLTRRRPGAESLRVAWSPQVVVMERRVNQSRLRDLTCSVEARCATFEGIEGLSVLGAVAAARPPAPTCTACS